MSDFPANWYPDPTNRHELRYWDGRAWTAHVSDHGATGQDPTGAGAPAHESARSLVSDQGFAPPGGRRADVHKQLSGQGISGAGIQGQVSGGGGTIFDEPILIVNQKAKVIELKNEYSVFDQNGNQIAQVEQIGQSVAKKALRLVGNLDSMMSHKLQISDVQGVRLIVHKQRSFVKSTIIVSDGREQEIGRIIQEKMIGKINFRLESHGQVVGHIKGENWRAWNFRIEDAGGTEVARITKTYEGFLKAAFTTADKYVVQIHERQPDPLNSLIVAAALSIDTALKQTEA